MRVLETQGCPMRSSLLERASFALDRRPDQGVEPQRLSRSPRSSLAASPTWPWRQPDAASTSGAGRYCRRIASRPVARDFVGVGVTASETMPVKHHSIGVSGLQRSHSKHRECLCKSSKSLNPPCHRVKRCRRVHARSRTTANCAFLRQRVAVTGTDAIGIEQNW